MPGFLKDEWLQKLRSATRDVVQWSKKYTPELTRPLGVQSDDDDPLAVSPDTGLKKYIHGCTQPFAQPDSSFASMYLQAYNIHSSTRLSIHLSIHPLIHPPIHPFIPPIHSSHPFIHPSIHSSIYLLLRRISTCWPISTAPTNQWSRACRPQ